MAGTYNIVIDWWRSIYGISLRRKMAKLNSNADECTKQTANEETPFAAQKSRHHLIYNNGFAFQTEQKQRFYEPGN